MSPPKPPTIELMLSEGLHRLESPAELTQRLLDTGLLRDLQQQADYSTNQWIYPLAARTASEFIALPGGALDPFSFVGKCNSLGCRLKAALAFARSLALYADRIMVPDVFTAMLWRASEVPPGHREFYLRDLHNNLSVLNELLPLIEHGTLQFGPPTHAMCLTCCLEADRRLDTAMRELTRSIALDTLRLHGLQVDSVHHWVSISCSLITSATGHPLILQRDVDPPIADQVAKALAGKRKEQITAGVRSPPKLGRLLLEQLREKLTNEMREIVFSLIESERTGAVLAAGSQLESQFLQRIGSSSHAARLSTVESWELSREVKLPVISLLSVEEVLRLKDEAAYALPALRELLARRLADEAVSSEKAVAVVSELRSHAPAVKAELDGWARSSSRRFERAVVPGALSLVVYSLFNPGYAPAALAAALGALYAVHGAKTKEEVETAKLKALPAYVLVKADEILQRRIES